MITDIRRIDASLTISCKDNNGNIIEDESKDTLNLSVLFDSRDFSEKDIHKIIGTNINNILNGDMSCLGNKILVADSTNINRLTAFLSNIYNNDNVDSE